MANVEFIKYDGRWPYLCKGILSIKVNGKPYYLKNVLLSGGCIITDDDGISKYPEQREWSVLLDSYPELKPYEQEITDCVNENVEFGCCGGCI